MPTRNKDYVEKLMPRTCYVVFEANPNSRFAYKCGTLYPVANHLVVIELKDGRKKLVTCVHVSDEDDDKATKTIFATLQEQTNAP